MKGNVLIVFVVLIAVALGAWYYLGNSSEELQQRIPPGEVTASEEFIIIATDFEFDKKELVVKKGTRISIVLENHGGTHDWRLDEFGAKTKKITTGQVDFVEFIASETGEFEYYCSVGDHRAKGMVGTLIVE